MKQIILLGFVASLLVVSCATTITPTTPSATLRPNTAPTIPASKGYPVIRSWQNMKVAGWNKVPVAQEAKKGLELQLNSVKNARTWTTGSDYGTLYLSFYTMFNEYKLFSVSHGKGLVGHPDLSAIFVVTPYQVKLDSDQILELGYYGYFTLFFRRLAGTDVWEVAFPSA